MSYHGERYGDDIDRLSDILSRAGFSLTNEQVERAWEDFSESYCAGWMMLYEDDETNLDAIRGFLPIDEEGRCRLCGSQDMRTQEPKA